MADDVFVKFEYDERDIWNGMRLRLRDSGGIRAVLALLVLVAPLPVAALALVHRPWVTPVAGGFLGAEVLVGVFLLFRVAPPIMFAGTFDRAAGGGGAPEGFRDASMTVDASSDGVAVTLRGRVSTLRWPDCLRLDESPASFILHFGQHGFVVIPRRAFRTAARDAAFRELVLEGLASKDRDVEEEGDEDEEVDEEDGDDGPKEEAEAPKREPVRVESVGRNELCPCGSGKKYKKCCLAKDLSGRSGG